MKPEMCYETNHYRIIYFVSKYYALTTELTSLESSWLYTWEKQTIYGVTQKKPVHTRVILLQVPWFIRTAFPACFQKNFPPCICIWSMQSERAKQRMREHNELQTCTRPSRKTVHTRISCFENVHGLTLRPIELVVWFIRRLSCRWMKRI